MSTDEKPASAAGPTRPEAPRDAPAARGEGVGTDEMKRKFKEALDKKNAQTRQGESHMDADSAIHGTHGAMTKREFRRKSG